MKQLMAVIILAATALPAAAQDGFVHFFARGGAGYEKAASATAGLDFAAKHHSSYEVAAMYFRKTNGYENGLVGVNYKPVVIRDKNTTLKFRIGGYMGTDMDRFTAAPNIGMEFLHSVSGKVDIVATNNNGCYFFAKKGARWRMSVEIGFRMAL